MLNDIISRRRFVKDLALNTPGVFLPRLRKIGLHLALNLLSMGISFCFFVCAVVQAHVKDGFEND